MESNFLGEKISLSSEHPSLDRYVVGLAIDQVGEAIVITDPAGKILYANSAFTMMTGYTCSEVVGHNQRLLKSGEQDPAYYADLWRVIKSGQTWHGELINRRKDGTTYREEMTITPVLDSRGEILRYIAVKRDVTERRAAEEMRTFLAAILASSDDAIIGRKLDGTIQIWNRGAEALFEYAADEVAGKPLSILFPSDLRKDISSVLASARVERSGHFETTLNTKSSRPINVLITVFPVKNSRGNLVGSAIIVRDISERKRSEDILRESEIKYRTVFETSRDALLMADAQTGMIVDANPAAEALLGRSLEEIRTLHQAQVHATEDASTGRAAFQRHRQITEVSEHVVLRGDGRRVPVEIAASPMTDARGRALVLGSFRDVTERRRAEESMRESEERFRTMADGCPTIIWVTDAEGKIQFANRTYREYFGVSYEQIEASKFQLLIHPDDAPLYLPARRSALEKRVTFTGEARFRRADGEWRWVASHAVPRLSASGEFLGVVGVTTDIHERKEVELSLRKAKEAAEAATRAKSEFLSNMSHEIRTPMNGVIGMTELALSTELTEEQRYFLNTARSSAEALLVVINDVLDFSKIEAGRLELEQVNFNLTNLVEDALRTMSIQADQLGVELACDVDDNLPQSLIGDPGRVRQVLLNLLGNALKFTQKGEVVVKLSGVLVSPARWSISIAVTDTGIGIAPEQLAKIFRPFTQADGSTTRKYGGTGLGLTICRQFAEAMGGGISVISEVGQGSTFTFTFGAAESEASRPPSTRESSSPEGLAARSVLVVDDNDTNQAILARVLARWDMQSTHVAGGGGALLAIQDAKQQGRNFDLILVDARMPDMNGFALCEKLHSLPGLTTRIVLMLSSASFSESSSLLRELRVAGYVMKPVQPVQLKSVMLRVIKGTSQGPPANDGGSDREISKHERQLSILLVDDNLVNQQLASRLLQKRGHKVRIAGDGFQAVSAAQEVPFDLILMDIQMPGMDGDKAAQEIRSREGPNRQTPIIALTAHALASSREAWLRAGMNGYITKPIRLPELWAEVERIMDVETAHVPACGSDANSP